MTKKELLQVFQDFSEQYGETYEQRAIFDSEFGELADVLLKQPTALDLIAQEREKQISKAMEQYGKECHADGMREGHSHGIAWAEKYLPELNKLRELVQAQKELIEIMQEYVGADYCPMPVIMQANELFNKIKQLEA